MLNNGALGQGGISYVRQALATQGILVSGINVFFVWEFSGDLVTILEIYLC